MPKHSYSFDAIGTQWLIETSADLSATTRQKIITITEAFDAVYSRFRPDSLVRVIAEQGQGEYIFPDSVVPLLDWYRKLYDATNQKVSPLVGTTLESLGYDQTYSLTKKGNVSAPAWDDAISLVGTTLHVSQPITLDIGAAGKGYLVDCISDILKQDGITSYVIDASGDIYTADTDQTVGLEDPFDTTRVLGVTHINNESLCASASNRRVWGEGLHHIVDPETAQPVSDVIATWVIAPTTMEADGLATALFFTAPEQLQGLADFSYAILFNDGSMNYSKDNKWEMFA